MEAIRPLVKRVRAVEEESCQHVSVAISDRLVSLCPDGFDCESLKVNRAGMG